MRIYLRPITLKDGSTIVKWRNAPSILSRCLIQKPISIESNQEFFHRNVETGLYKQYIVEKLDEDFSVASYPIATVYLKDMDKYNKRCELCVFTSDDEEWNTESQAIAIKMLLDKAFKDFGMHKVYSYAFSKFSDEMHLLLNAGFQKEAVFKNESLDLNGQYQDLIRFAIFNENTEASESD